MDDVAITSHDGIPAGDAAIVDAGLGAYNDGAAPLNEVRRLACFARDASGTVVGGAVGRTWGECAEIQQLWVDAAHRDRGIGTKLVRAFESAARTRGCGAFYLETFDFQAPGFYRKLGYGIAFALDVYPRGVVRYTMLKRDDGSA